MIVLTGASGQLGGQVAKLLEGTFAAGELRFTSQDTAKLADAAQRGIDVRQANFDDPAGLEHAFEGADQLVIISTSGSDEERETRHSAAIQAASRAGVGHVAYTSYAPVAHGLHLIHAQTNANTEAELRESGLPFTILRNNYYAELLLMFAGIALETGHIRLPAGSGTAAMISRGDIARAIVATLTPGFEPHPRSSTRAKRAGRATASRPGRPRRDQARPAGPAPRACGGRGALGRAPPCRRSSSRTHPSCRRRRLAA